MTRTWRTWKWPAPVSPVRAVHVLGLGAVIAGVCFWGYRLHGPQAAAPQAQPSAAVPADRAAQAVAAWLGPGQMRLNVVVIGLVRRHDRAVAVLAINGALPKAYMAGETLAREVTLASIETDAVTIERAGIATRIPAPLRPDYGPPGIVRVP